jgi:hypothetical protein
MGVESGLQSGARIDRRQETEHRSQETEPLWRGWEVLPPDFNEFLKIAVGTGRESY